MAINPVFNLQWHLTTRCELKCRHCYLRGRNRSSANELDLDQCCQVIDSFVHAAVVLDARPTVDLTGGDPLLYQHFWELLDYLRKKNVQISILGTPDKLNHFTAKQLKSYGAMDYQLSIDGLEEKHDWLRHKGSFAKNMEAFGLLKQYDISTGMMYTLTRHNRDDLIPVMNLAAEMEHRAFAFDTVSPVGPEDGCQSLMLSPLEFRQIYKEYLQESKRLGEKGYRTVFTRKNHLYALIMEEENRLKPIESDRTTYFMGCPIGKGLIINADGSVLCCPRIPIEIGRVPQEEILDILLYSDMLTKFRDRSNHRVCGNCSLFQYCRGCRASAWGVSGDIFGPDPYCWKQVEAQDVETPLSTDEGEESIQPSQEQSYENGRKIMSIYYGWDYQPRPKYDANVQQILGRAWRDLEFRKQLLTDPEEACQQAGIEVSDTILFELGRIEFDSIYDILADTTNQ